METHDDVRKRSPMVLLAIACVLAGMGITGAIERYHLGIRPANAARAVFFSP